MARLNTSLAFVENIGDDEVSAFKMLLSRSPL